MTRALTKRLALLAFMVAGVVAGLLMLRAASTGTAQESASPGAAIAMDPAATGLRVELGVGQEPPTSWEGEIHLSAGKVHQIDLWEPGARSNIEGSRFTTRTPRGRRRRRARAVPPQLFITLTAPPGTEVELKTNHGPARFSLSEVSADQPLTFLDDQVRIWSAPAVFQLTRPDRDDDFPDATLAPDGSVWVAYLSYQRGQPLDQEAIQNRQFDSLEPRNNGDRVFLIRYEGQQWSAPLEVTEAPGNVWHPTVASDGAGKIWVTWSQQHENNWDLYQRHWDPKVGEWSAVQRLTNDPGADINAVSVGDALGHIWWAWQARRGDNFDILLASSQDSGSQPSVVANSPANEWDPSVAADLAGNVYVGWDSYEAGNYDVLVRRFGERPSGPIQVAATTYFEARASLACDSSGRLWVAYEEDDPNWGKDYATGNANRPVENLGAPLYINRRVRVKCLQGNGLAVPAGDLSEAYGDKLNRPKSFPRLGTDASGKVWLFFRHHPRPSGQGVNWAGYVTHYDGQQWAPAQFMPASDYVMDNRPAVVPWKKEGVLALYTSDARLRASRGDPDNDLFAAVFSASTAAAEVKLAADDSFEPQVVPVHQNEDQAIARLRRYRIELAGKTYQLLRGEFHRHTEYTSHRDQDGSLEDMWRYALDAADMDWIGNGDHDNGGGREYFWWTIQKLTDVFHHPPYFVPPFTYERSVRFPNGHRNVMFARRGIRPLPRGELPGTPEEGTPDTKLLYAYLHHYGGICAVHTSGTGMGTDWRDNDPEVEPMVEIYQGHRHNYEHYGAPRSATAETQIGRYQPAGFVWNALARGYRLGFESSSDHVSTHISYTMALAEGASREALVDAFRKRHCYAATDNILLDVRAGDHLMGDEFSSQEPVRLWVKVIGTRPIDKISIIKNNGYVYSMTPTGAEAEFTWQELNQPAGTLAYYYVRMEQEDGQLAWSSPIWVRYE
ncbi:hypothetical protein MYX65_03010 [Acidobacteria bacterium AH-259-L09]|nr:hypothetical protein [Acidobacteria bacterium AH-259-L09]